MCAELVKMWNTAGDKSFASGLYSDVVNVGSVQSFRMSVRVQDIQKILANNSPEVETMSVRLGPSRSVVGRVEMV
jgi:hypothetical protein